jgi:two-component system, NarL family, nitrate/nitrite response regulator NarL
VTADSLSRVQQAPEPDGPDSSPSEVRVLLCDDAVAFSALFSRWMKQCGIEMVGQADSADEAVAMVAEKQPDVVVIDHLLHEVTSDALAPRLREAAPNSRLLVISGMPDDVLAEVAAAAGADAHLSKAASQQAMCDAVLELARR